MGIKTDRCSGEPWDFPELEIPVYDEDQIVFDCLHGWNDDFGEWDIEDIQGSGWGVYWPQAARNLDGVTEVRAWLVTSPGLCFENAARAIVCDATGRPPTGSVGTLLDDTRDRIRNIVDVDMAAREWVDDLNKHLIERFATSHGLEAMESNDDYGLDYVFDVSIPAGTPFTHDVWNAAVLDKTSSALRAATDPGGPHDHTVEWADEFEATHPLPPILREIRRETAETGDDAHQGDAPRRTENERNPDD